MDVFRMMRMLLIKGRRKCGSLWGKISLVFVILSFRSCIFLYLEEILGIYLGKKKG